MTSTTTKPDSSQPAAAMAVDLFDNWFDPIESAVRDRVRGLGKPGIFNTDQGSQFTSFAFTNTLKDAGIRISMRGRVVS